VSLLRPASHRFRFANLHWAGQTQVRAVGESNFAEFLSPTISAAGGACLQGEWLMTAAEVDYVGTRMIGLGSVGQVFKARLAVTGELIAVKVVRDDLTERTRARNRTVEDQVGPPAARTPHAAPRTHRTQRRPGAPTC
jgi:hypothetical protein